MNKQVFPTKSNLIAINKQLRLAKLGYELLDRKRNILMREMMALAKTAQDLQEETDRSFKEAYAALLRANFTLGQSTMSKAAKMQSEKDNLTVRYRSVMGIEIPEIVEAEIPLEPNFGVSATDSYADKAFIKFNAVRSLAAKQAAVNNSVYRLAFAIEQSLKRANALKNIVIPMLEGQVSYIVDYLEEKEREQFSSMKLIKKNRM